MYTGNKYLKSLCYYKELTDLIFTLAKTNKFIQSHEEFFNDFFLLISSSICRIDDLIETDLKNTIDIIIKHDNIEKDLFKNLLILLNKLDDFSKLFKVYRELYKNLIIYIREEINKPN